MRCAVNDCKNTNHTKPNTISFFNFPTDVKLLKQWESFCCRGKKKFNAKTSHICMEHFQPEDFENSLKYEMGFTSKRYLKSGAVPTIRKESHTNEKCYNERAERIQKQEYKKIVENLIKEHDGVNVFIKDSNELSVLPQETYDSMGPQLYESDGDQCVNVSRTQIQEYVKEEMKGKLCESENPLILSNHDKETDVEYLKGEITRLRQENFDLKHFSEKQASKLLALQRKRQKECKIYKYNSNCLKTHLRRANYEFCKLEAKLLDFVTKNQIAKIKRDIKESNRSDNHTSAITSYKLYKLQRKKTKL